eukprot:7388997-Prymnesium_polylepis.1
MRMSSDHPCGGGSMSRRLSSSRKSLPGFGAKMTSHSSHCDGKRLVRAIVCSPAKYARCMSLGALRSK